MFSKGEFTFEFPNLEFLVSHEKFSKNYVKLLRKIPKVLSGD